METLCQGIIRPACQARRVWHVVKRPSQLSPKNSLCPLLPLPPRSQSRLPLRIRRRRVKGDGGCKNTCISTKDNDYHGRIPRNTARRNFYGISRCEILQKVAASWNYTVTLSYAGSPLSPFSLLSIGTREVLMLEDIGGDKNMEESPRMCPWSEFS